MTMLVHILRSHLYQGALKNPGDADYVVSDKDGQGMLGDGTVSWVDRPFANSDLPGETKFLTAAQIASPTAEILADTSARYIGPDGEVLRSSGLVLNLESGSVRKPKAAKVGFNYYSLVTEILDGIANIATNRPLQLQYAADCGANVVRIALPCFSSAQYLTQVHSTASMPATVLDSNLRSTFIAAIDTAFAAAEAAGLMLYVTDSWAQSFLPVALGETVANGYTSTSTKTAIYMRSAAIWFMQRYGRRVGLYGYAIGNEWLTDPAGTSAPTEAQLAEIYEYVLSPVRSVAPGVVFGASVSFMGVTVSRTRATIDDVANSYKALFGAVDAIEAHFYSINGYVGRNADENATFPNSTANTLGYEGLELTSASLAQAAHALGKLFIVGEIGISTANESDSLSAKKVRAIRAVANHADLVLVWNIQDSVQASGAGQSTWFIAPSTTRGTTFQNVLLPYRYGPELKALIMGATDAIRTSLRPEFCMTTTRTASALCSLVSNTAMATTNAALLCWFRLNATLNSFETLVDFRGAGNLSGAVILGENTAATSVFAEFRGAAGNAGNTAAEWPDLVVGRWYHLAVSYEAVAATVAITTWLNGAYWKTTTTSGTYAAIPNGTTLEFLGGSSGAPISMQDLVFCPSIHARDVAAHMRGETIPQTLLHVRAFPNGTILDVGPSKLTVTVGGGVSVEAAS